MKLNHKYIYEPIFHAHVDLYWKSDPSAVNASLKRKYSIDEAVPLTDDYSGYTAVLSGADGSTVFVLYLRDTKDTVPHEVFHLAHKILDSRGVSLCAGSEEVFAYYVGYWMKQIQTVIKGGG